MKWKIKELKFPDLLNIIFEEKDALQFLIARIRAKCTLFRYLTFRVVESMNKENIKAMVQRMDYLTAVVSLLDFEVNKF